ncbi:MAG: translation initiation factor IF-2 [Lachnospiraceae bacterium]|jgi:translation initiation factor IF-2|nr:translation initiation factor IF-2 [Lachnospiraceae bacterium]
MRVNELAKELGKSNKEVLDILQKQNQDVKTHSSNITEEQIQMVRRAAGEKAAGADSKGAEGQSASQAEAPKKKIAAVYRPQNSQQRPARPKTQQGRGTVPGKTQGGARSSASGTGTAKSQTAQGQGLPKSQPASGAARTQNTQGKGLASGIVKAQTQQNPGTPTEPRPQSRQEQNPASGAGKAQGAESGVLKSQNNQEQSAGTAKTQGAQGQIPALGAGKAQPAQDPIPASDTERPQSSQRGINTARAQDQSQAAGAAKPQGQDGAAGTGRPQTTQNQTGVRGQAGQANNGARGQSYRDGGRPQGSGRDGNRGANYGGSRDGNRGGGRDGERGAGGFGGNRDGNRSTGGFGGNRDGNRGAGGFGGNRDGNRSTGGFGGNRDGNRGAGGFGGNRDGNRGAGGFGGNRDGNRGAGGFGGNRDGNRGAGGFGGNRDGNRGAGGFGGGARGGAARPGQRDSGSKSFDTPIQSKPTSSRKNNNNNYKNDRYDKKNVNEDGPRSKGGKVSKHTLSMPQKTAQKQAEEVVKVITLPEVLTIKELADKMKLQPSVIIKKLFLQGQIVTVNSEIDFDKAEEIAMEYDVLCEKEEKIDVIAELLKEDEEDEADMVPRSPVVCVMGHVDHGKTSLLDAIRSTNVTSREAGGITQHIGAYTVEINEQQITFLDTPGHEAFTAMRMRGAQSTDIAILVVAADDGVMPQTVEAINHAKAAEVEILVAINKIDKPSANIDRVKQELSEYELVPEDWGGSTIFVPVSAHTKEGISELLEMILLAAEVKELRANPNRKARGLVIEAELDKGKGPVATILVQKGTLRVGDSVTAGACYGKVRAMMDDKGRRVKEAGPSQPVEILGLNDVPGAGDVLMATENEKEARSYAQTFITESKNKLLEDTKSRLSLDDLFSQIKAGNVKELPIIVKADVQGSVEAVKESLVKLSNEEVMVKVIHGGVGAINESDVTLASASNAIIIGFNVRPDVTAKSIAEREKVDLRLYRVIYQAIEDVEAAMKGMLDPVFEEQVIGHAVVRQLFKASGVGTIAGSYITDGKFQRGCSCRITRGKDQIFEGALASLKRFKDDVKEVATGYECGLVFDKFNDLQEDDVIEAYIMVEVPR